MLGLTVVGAGNHENAVVRGEPVDFVEEVASALFRDDRVNVLENEKARARLSRQAENVAEHPRVRSALDVQRWNRRIALGKLMHHGFDRNRLAVARRAVENQASLRNISTQTAVGAVSLPSMGRRSPHIHPGCQRISWIRLGATSSSLGPR